MNLASAPPRNWRRGLLRLWLVLSVAWAITVAWREIAYQAVLRERFLASCPLGEAFNACFRQMQEATSLLTATRIESWVLGSLVGILAMPLALGIILAVRGVLRWIWRGFVSPPHHP